MAQKGRAGAALAVAAIGSWVAGTLGVVGVMLFAPPLANAALAFGPPEYFAISIFGMLLLCNLTGGSFLRALFIFVIGVMVSTIGIDQLTGIDRLSFGMLELTQGIDLLPIVMGLFGMAEIFAVAVMPYDISDLIKVKFRDLYPNKIELKRSLWPIFRGSGIGFPVGLLPGPSALLSSLLSYRAEKLLSKQPEEFGKGAIEGVAGPESANNAASSGAMVPLLALGIPFAPATAVLMGGLMIHGVSPGPLFITQHNDLFWLVIASMYIGNIMLLVLNLPLVGVFASITKLPARILMPIVTAIMFIGCYSINNSYFDLVLLVVFGLLGYILKYFNFSPVQLVVGFVLGPIFEKSLRQSLVLFDGNFLFFFQRPISGILLGIAIIISAWIIIGTIKKRTKTTLEG